MCIMCCVVLRLLQHGPASTCTTRCQAMGGKIVAVANLFFVAVRSYLFSRAVVSVVLVVCTVVSEFWRKESRF